MEKYEIINPSDKCFIYADNVKVAQMCCLYLGNGSYGLQDSDGNAVMEIFLFSGADEWLAENVPAIEAFLTEHHLEMATCMESFEYASERTSINNIGKNAERLASVLLNWGSKDVPEEK